MGCCDATELKVERKSLNNLGGYAVVQTLMPETGPLASVMEMVTL